MASIMHAERIVEEFFSELIWRQFAVTGNLLNTGIRSESSRRAGTNRHDFEVLSHSTQREIGAIKVCSVLTTRRYVA
jgi:hypothetical protein